MIASARKKGFTLIEVTIALAILAAALVTLLAGINSGVMFADRDRDYTIAAFLAREKMTDLERDPEMTTSGHDEKGAFKDEFERFEWHVEIAPDENALALADYAGVPFEPLKATVTISWKHGKIERKYILQEIFFPEVISFGR